MAALGAEHDPAGQIADEQNRRVALAFVAGINDRDPEALAAIFSPQAEFRPRVLSMSHSSYRGREGLNDYFRDLRRRDRGQQVQVREIRPIGPVELVILADVVAEGEPISPAAIIIALQDGMIIRASGYLSDEDTMISVGLIPAPE